MNVDLVLGTANFGARYGISNRNQLLQEEEVARMVRLAERSGSIQFDTAPAYGNAETQLGRALSDPKKARVFTKIDGENSSSASKMIKSVTRSLLRTKVARFSGVYLHDERALESSNAQAIVSGLRELLDSGVTERVGISVYSIESALRAKEICPELSLFQVSENICDRRLYKVNEMNKLAQEGNDFYVRSIFLQGLLLMEIKDLPEEFSKITPTLISLIEYANSLNVSREALCLAYARQISWAKGIVVGVASLSQLEQLFAHRVELQEDFEEHIATLDLEFLDPRKWSDLK